MNEPKDEQADRVDLARWASKDFYANCFRSYREDLEITEAMVPFVGRGLRQNGGLEGTA